MRLAAFVHDGQSRCGVVSGGLVHPYPAGATILDPATPAADGIPLSSVRLLPPLKPPSVRDFVAFEEHVEGIVRSVSGAGGVVPEWYEAPQFYFTNPHALIGAHDDLPVPPGCVDLDFELEVAAIIGTGGANVSPAEAPSHIFGYTVFNDWSARDLQRREMRVGLGPAIGMDFASTLGPRGATADELAPYATPDGRLQLSMTVSGNGAEVGRDMLSSMAWPFGDLVAYASRGTVVMPGDVLGSGTCGNGGCLAELWGRAGRQSPPPLKPGDIVEMTVEAIGTIRNKVVAGVAPAPIATARRRS